MPAKLLERCVYSMTEICNGRVEYAYANIAVGCVMLLYDICNFFQVIVC